MKCKVIYSMMVNGYIFKHWPFLYGDGTGKEATIMEDIRKR